jgi:hypothetical protein
MRVATAVPVLAFNSNNPCVTLLSGSLKPKRLTKILRSSVTANPFAFPPAIGGGATFQRTSLPLEASTSMYWAADAKKTEIRSLLQRRKLLPGELICKIASADLEMESRATRLSTPAGQMEFVRSYNSIRFGLPSNRDGSAPALRFSRPAQRLRMLWPACSPSRLCDPLHRRLQRLRCLCHCFDCYRVERTSSRAGIPPLWTTTFSRRTGLAGNTPRLRHMFHGQVGDAHRAM